MAATSVEVSFLSIDIRPTSYVDSLIRQKICNIAFEALSWMARDKRVSADTCNISLMKRCQRRRHRILFKDFENEKKAKRRKLEVPFPLFIFIKFSTFLFLLFLHSCACFFFVLNNLCSVAAQEHQSACYICLYDYSYDFYIKRGMLYVDVLSHLYANEIEIRRAGFVVAPQSFKQNARRRSSFSMKRCKICLDIAGCVCADVE